jgi:hypothetical protein
MEKDMKKDKTAMKPDERISINISSHLVIRDKETGQVLVKKRG